MRESTRVLSTQRMAGAVPAGSLAMGLRQFAGSLSEQPENAPRFAGCLLAGTDAGENIGLYLLAMQMLRHWAGQKSLDGPDAFVIEESRKICDVMGWMPLEK